MSLPSKLALAAVVALGGAVAWLGLAVAHWGLAIQGWALARFEPPP